MEIQRTLIAVRPAEDRWQQSFNGLCLFLAATLHPKAPPGVRLVACVGFVYFLNPFGWWSRVPDWFLDAAADFSALLGNARRQGVLRLQR